MHNAQGNGMHACMCAYVRWGKTLWFSGGTVCCPAGVTGYCSSRTLVYMSMSAQEFKLTSYASRRMSGSHARELTQQEKLFVTKYLECHDELQAYEHAGYSMQGKPRTVRTLAARLLARPAIAASINRSMANAKHHATITGARVLTHLWEMASADVRELFDSTGKLKLPHEWPEALGRAIQSLDLLPRKDGSMSVVRVTLANRSQNAQTLAKATQLFTDAPEVAVNVDLRGVDIGRLHEIADALARNMSVGQEEVLASLGMAPMPAVPVHTQEAGSSVVRELDESNSKPSSHA